MQGRGQSIASNMFIVMKVWLDFIADGRQWFAGKQIAHFVFFCLFSFSLVFGSFMWKCNTNIVVGMCFHTESICWHMNTFRGNYLSRIGFMRRGKKLKIYKNRPKNTHILTFPSPFYLVLLLVWTCFRMNAFFVQQFAGISARIEQ